LSKSNVQIKNIKTLPTHKNIVIEHKTYKAN